MSDNPLHTFVCMMRLAGFTPQVSEDGQAIFGPRGSIRQAWKGSRLLRVRVMQQTLVGPLSFVQDGRKQEVAAGDFDPSDLPSGCAALINIGVADHPDLKAWTGHTLSQLLAKSAQ